MRSTSSARSVGVLWDATATVEVVRGVQHLITMRLSPILTSCALFVGTGSAAQADGHSIRLHDAVAQATANNPLIATATLAVVGEEASLDELRGTYTTMLELSTSGARQRDQPRFTLLSQPRAADVVGGSVALTRTFEAGTETRVTASMQRKVVTTRIATSHSAVDLTERTIVPRLEASIRQPLWGGRRVGSALRERLDATRDAAFVERIATTARVLRDVEHAYWQLYLAQREVEIRHDATTAAELQLRQVEAEISRGARPRLAAAEIEEEVARRREDELIVRGAIGERSLELSRLLGATPTTELRAGDVPSPPEHPATELVSAEAAPTVRVGDSRAEAAHAEVLQAEDEARWRIDATLTGALSAARDGMHDAFEDTAGYGGWSLQAGITLRAPLDDRGSRAKVDGARARWVAARVAREDAAAQLMAEVEVLRNRRALALQRSSALVRARELAEQNLAAEQGRWERGDTTAFELLRRQASVGEIRLRIERAQVDLLDADAGLAAASGELLARHGVTLR